MVEEEEEEEERERLLATDTQEPFVVEIMNTTEAKNRKINVGDDIDIEIPDTAHQISSGLLFRFSPPFFFLVLLF